jgi:hypothetical protein
MVLFACASFRLGGVFWVLWFYGIVVASGAGRDCLCTNLTCSFALMQKNQKIKAVYRFPACSKLGRGASRAAQGKQECRASQNSL